MSVCVSVSNSHYFCIQRIWSFLKFIDTFRIQGNWLFPCFMAYSCFYCSHTYNFCFVEENLPQVIGSPVQAGDSVFSSHSIKPNCRGGEAPAVTLLFIRSSKLEFQTLLSGQSRMSVREKTTAENLRNKT